jgi:hypothetical protein
MPETIMRRLLCLLLITHFAFAAEPIASKDHLVIIGDEHLADIAKVLKQDLAPLYKARQAKLTISTKKGLTTADIIADHTKTIIKKKATRVLIGACVADVWDRKGATGIDPATAIASLGPVIAACTAAGIHVELTTTPGLSADDMTEPVAALNAALLNWAAEQGIPCHNIATRGGVDPKKGLKLTKTGAADLARALHGACGAEAGVPSAIADGGRITIFSPLGGKPSSKVKNLLQERTKGYRHTVSIIGQGHNQRHPGFYIADPNVLTDMPADVMVVILGQEASWFSNHDYAFTSTKHYRQQIDAILDLLLQREGTVYLGTPLPTNQMADSEQPLDTSDDAVHMQVAACIREACAERGLLVIDLHQRALDRLATQPGTAFIERSGGNTSSVYSISEASVPLVVDTICDFLALP